MNDLHVGFDHRGQPQRCVQEIHFCIDDYGIAAICEAGHLTAAALTDPDDVALCAHRHRESYCRRLAFAVDGAGAVLYHNREDHA